MSESEYKISIYHPNFLHQVVDLLHYLWGDDFDANLHYFRWKYEDNPYAKSPLGIVALKHQRIVGFRGYFATKWKIPRKYREILVLCPGDTCVHPDHRRNNLSVAMGNFAMKEYASEYKIFFNLSASGKSTPGYLKMGFIPLKTKTLLSRCNLLGMTKFLLIRKKRSNFNEKKIMLGNFDRIIVSDHPRSKEMAEIVFKRRYHKDKITLLQDKVFFHWRFQNKRKKYIFYYYKDNNSINSYIVMRLSPNNRRGYICDYASDDNKFLEEIIKFIIRMKHLDVISIYRYSLTDNFLRILNRLRFQKNSFIRLIEKRLTGEWPLLIRPVKNDFSDSDLHIAGLDIRKIENWEIKEICSDAA
jgi:hypothetical protein